MSCCPNGIFAPLIRDCNGNVRPLMSSEQLLVGGSYIGSWEHIVPGGRLSLDSSDPLSGVNEQGGDVYYLPYKHDKIPLWNGIMWKLYSFTDGVTAEVPETTDTNYDVFLYWDTVTESIKMEFSEWATFNTRDADIVQVNGIWTKDNEPRKRYVGTVRTGATTGQVEDTSTQRFVFNQDNREWRRMLLNITEDWTLTGSTAARQLNNNTAYQFEYVVGQDRDVILYQFLHITGSMDAGNVWVGWDNDSIGFGFARMKFAGTVEETRIVDMNVLIPLGYHYYPACEQIDNAANTWTVTGSVSQNVQIRGQVKV